jgi:hypothetical protein
MRKATAISLAALGCALAMGLFAVLSTAQPSCNTYTNSTPTWIQGHGAVCAYTGPGCRECHGDGTTCVDSGIGRGCLDYPYW